MSLKIGIVCFLSSMAFGQFGHVSWKVEGDTAIMTLSSPFTSSGAPTTGAPYSGERVTEHLQILADGTRITQTPNSEKIWRDSEGRTRTERLLGRDPNVANSTGFPLVEVRDPVAGFLYILDDQHKVAHRYALTAPVRHQTPKEAPSGAQAAAKPAPQWTAEKLGSQTMEGLVVEGNKSTRTIPVGEIGNDRPIATSNESWFSRELKEMVLTKSFDPQYGENTVRLTISSRSEPDPSLFAVPSGYSVVDEKDSITMSLKRQ
jgi:hypothetical protein